MYSPTVEDMVHGALGRAVLFRHPRALRRRSPLIYSGKPVNFLAVRNSDGKSKSHKRGERVPPRGPHCVETLGCSKGLLCAFILSEERSSITFHSRKNKVPLSRVSEAPHISR
jgi:hypothetical protein